jgi:hypothetical protein
LRRLITLYDLLIVDNGASLVMEDMQIDVPDCVDDDHLSADACEPWVWLRRGILVSNCSRIDDRWFFASNDMVYLPGALESLSEARRDEITLSDMFPFWHTFSVGEEVVRRVGLFDEALYPAYFEDNDYERRAVHKNVHIRSVSIPTQHENSSTIGADRGLREKNAVSFQNNAIYYNNKMAKNDYGQGAWSFGP